MATATRAGPPAVASPSGARRGIASPTLAGAASPSCAGHAHPWRSLIASGLVGCAVLVLVVVAAVTGRGDRSPAEAAHSDTDDPEDAATGMARGQQHADLADEQLAAARGRAEAWVRDHLTWRHDEARGPAGSA